MAIYDSRIMFSVVNTAEQTNFAYEITTVWLQIHNNNNLKINVNQEDIVTEEYR